MTIRFVIPGPPRGKGRPRFASVGGHVRTFTDQKTRSYEAHVAGNARSVMAGREPMAGAVCVRLSAYFTPPKSASKKKRAAMLRGAIRPTTKTDADNIAKAVLDGLNGIAFVDDKFVCGLAVEKHYGEAPRVEVAIWPCKGVEQ